MTDKYEIGEGLYITFDGDRYEIMSHTNSVSVIDLSEDMMEKIEFFHEKVNENYV